MVVHCSLQISGNPRLVGLFLCFLFFIIVFPFLSCWSMHTYYELRYKCAANAHLQFFRHTVFWNQIISEVFPHCPCFVSSWQNLKSNNKEKRRPEPRYPLNQVEKEMPPVTKMTPVQAVELKEMCLRKESRSSSKAGLRYGFFIPVKSCPPIWQSQTLGALLKQYLGSAESCIRSVERWNPNNVTGG